jgi:hypothetical protein
MYRSKPRLFLAVALAIGVFFVPAPSAWGQNHCVQLRGTVSAMYNGTAWVGTTTWSFGGGPLLTAEITDVNTGMKKMDKNTWIGTETSTLDFGDGVFQLITRFVTQHMNDPFGMYRVNETGTIVGVSGKYAKVYGQFTVHGPFGPGLSQNGTWLWYSEYHGNICGLN